MTRKRFFIIITVILTIFVIGLASYYFLIVSKTTPTTTIPTNQNGFFPLGGNGGNTAHTQTNGGVVGSNLQATSTLNFTQKLREISSEPVAGFGLLDTKIGTIIR